MFAKIEISINAGKKMPFKKAVPRAVPEYTRIDFTNTVFKLEQLNPVPSMFNRCTFCDNGRT